MNKIPSVISKRNAISERRPKDKHTHVHTQKNERSESIVRTGLAREWGCKEGEPLLTRTCPMLAPLAKGAPA